MQQPMEPLYVGIDLDAVVAEMDARDRRSRRPRPAGRCVVGQAPAVSSRLSGVTGVPTSQQISAAPLIDLAR